ncbi:putative alkaline serine protease (PR1) [Penicillium brasilianum]|uniref:Putative alkaline serine protease (PR1) n=1 Tax=Penicillium brasilianum TaxID=104259 RepID=A0A1S9S1S7_PENBI|nr:putative alkaline serine protease (PR1) [Penicillium brasilianum]
MSTQQNIVPGQWIVSVKPYLTPELLQNEHLSALEDMTVDPSTPFKMEVLQKFDLPELKGYSAKFNDATKTELEKMSHVLAIEPEQLYDHCAVQADAPWGLGRISTRARLGPPPYRYQYREDAAGANTFVYVIDTGINDQHVEFERRASKGRKFVSDAPSSDEDIHGHGTHCAGTIASRAYGVAKKANVIGVKVFSDVTGYAQTSDIISALDWVVSDVNERGINGHAVVNMSLGGGSSVALDNAVASAVRHGAVVCVAAGNEALDAQEGSPAREPLAITVGATDVGDTLPPWSGYGKIVDILAPGVDVLSCWVGSQTATKRISGTSMATPHVSGVASCLLSDASWTERNPSEIMPKILILADKNKVNGITPPRERTIDALLQNTTGPTD